MSSRVSSAQKGGRTLAVEKDDAEEAIRLLARNLPLEQLEIVDVELAVKLLQLAQPVLPPRNLAHVLLTAHALRYLSSDLSS